MLGNRKSKVRILIWATIQLLKKWTILQMKFGGSFQLEQINWWHNNEQIHGKARTNYSKAAA